MSYVDKNSSVVSSLTELSLASTAVIQKFSALRQFIPRRLAIGITTATVSNANIVVTVKKYLALNNNANAVTLDTIVIPGGVAIGKMYYVDLNGATKIAPGEELVFEVTTAAAGGGAAGKGIAYVECEDSPEMPANHSLMIESA